MRAPPLRRALLSLPIWVVFLSCAALPLLWIGWKIISNPGALVELTFDEFRFRLLLRTLLYNISAGVIATLLAIPAAVVIGRGRGFISAILWIILPLTLLMPSVAYTYGWSQFVRLNLELFQRLGVSFEAGSPSDVVRCVWSLATWLWPIPAAVMGLALRRLDLDLQQQALLDGVLARVTAVHLLRPALLSCAIVAVLAMQEYAVYEPTGISVIATEVRMVFETGAFASVDNPMTAPIIGASDAIVKAHGLPTVGFANLRTQDARAAAAVITAAPMLTVIAMLTLVVLLTVRNTSHAEVIDIGETTTALSASWWFVSGSLIVILLTIGVPTLSLILSLKRPFDFSRVWSAFSPQLLGSLSIAFVTGLLAFAIALWAMARWSPGMLILGLAAFLVGGQLLAIAQIRLYNRPWLSAVYNAPPIVVMVYLSRFGWLALLAAGATWRGPWKQVRDMASLDGAGELAAGWRVIRPMAWPLAAAAGVVVMILSLSEVPATVLLAPQNPPMLTPLLMTWVHMLRYDDLIEGTLLLMIVSAILGIGAVGLVWLAARLRRGWKVEDRRLRKIVASSTFYLLLSTVSLLTTGCLDGSKPDAIWTETGVGPGQVVYPRGITYMPQRDTFFIVDRMARVQQIDHDGKPLNEWRMSDWAKGKPVGLSAGPDGNLYVPDTHYHRVRVYQPDGTMIREWGSFGTEPGQFIFPTDIAFDSKGNVFVSEYGDHDRIQVFTVEGKYLYEFGSFGQGDGQFARPQSLLIDNDLVYVTDASNHRIVVFKIDGTFVRNMCSVGSEPGQLRFPYGLDEDSDGNLIVAEFGNNRVQLIDKETGEGLKTWGTGGHQPGQLTYPWAVAVDKDDRIVAVDAGNNRLQVFHF